MAPPIVCFIPQNLTPKFHPFPCLGKIHQSVAQLIDLWKLRHLSVRETIYVPELQDRSNYGLCPRLPYPLPRFREIPVFEYAPLRVKQAVVGFGRASKEQMSQTLAQMLSLPESLPYDQSDALGLARALLDYGRIRFPVVL